jgi:hypothetical protein
MEVVYEADGYQTMHIGARLPFEGEPLEAIVQMYAPLSYWEQSNNPVAVVQVGLSGVLGEALATPSNSAEAAVARRNTLLVESDWTQLIDAPFSVEQKSDWAAYRQQLRELTDQAGFPDNIMWPTKPGIRISVL